MRKNLLLIKSIFCMLLCLASAALGGSYAMADVTIASEQGPETAADSKGLETQQNGQQASASNVVATDFNEEDIEKAVAKFRPFQFPLENDIANQAKQVPTKSYIKKHYRSGAAVLEDVLLEDVATSGGEVTIKKAQLQSGSVQNFPECACVSAVGTDNDSGMTLNFYVTACSRALGSFTMTVLNSDTDVTIPSGTKLILCATACSESQMIVTPDNYQPVPVEVYLQKKITNLVLTDEWIQIAKKADFVLADLQDNAIYNFKRRIARWRWLGCQKRISVELSDEKMGNEYVYFEEGILRQLTMFYSIGSTGITQYDLNAIAKMQFTDYSVNNTARAYCGKNFIENLLNMPAHVERGFFFENKEEAGMKLRVWTNNFGTIEFVHDPTLNDIGYEDFCVIVDIKNATHYVKRAQKTDTQDMKKGTGEIREARRYVISMIDCVALKGYNSILVGPADKIAVAQNLKNINDFSTAVDSLDDVTDEDKTFYTIFYLNKTDEERGFAEGTLLKWVDGQWVEFKGGVVVS